MNEDLQQLYPGWHQLSKQCPRDGSHSDAKGSHVHDQGQDWQDRSDESGAPIVWQALNHRLFELNTKTQSQDWDRHDGAGQSD